MPHVEMLTPGVHDLAGRSVLRVRGLALAAILTLVLGIGATTTMVSV
jgi:hypothetical protein